MQKTQGYFKTNLTILSVQRVCALLNNMRQYFSEMPLQHNLYLHPYIQPATHLHVLNSFRIMFPAQLNCLNNVCNNVWYDMSYLPSDTGIGWRPYTREQYQRRSQCQDPMSTDKLHVSDIREERCLLFFLNTQKHVRHVSNLQ